MEAQNLSHRKIQSTAFSIPSLELDSTHLHKTKSRSECHHQQARKPSIDEVLGNKDASMQACKHASMQPSSRNPQLTPHPPTSHPHVQHAQTIFAIKIAESHPHAQTTKPQSPIDGVSHLNRHLKFSFRSILFSSLSSRTIVLMTILIPKLNSLSLSLVSHFRLSLKSDFNFQPAAGRRSRVSEHRNRESQPKMNPLDWKLSMHIGNGKEISNVDHFSLSSLNPNPPNPNPTPNPKPQPQHLIFLC